MSVKLSTSWTMTNRMEEAMPTKVKRTLMKEMERRGVKPKAVKATVSKDKSVKMVSKLADKVIGKLKKAKGAGARRGRKPKYAIPLREMSYQERFDALKGMVPTKHEAQALKLRQKGKTYTEIGEVLSCTKQNALILCKRAASKLGQGLPNTITSASEAKVTKVGKASRKAA